MNHDAYLCYDENDLDTVNHICNALEDNGIKCWFKSRDVGVNHMVDGIMEAIENSTLMILILSNNSKNSNFVNSEVDFAFDLKKQIIVYDIDDSKLETGLEFFLNNKPLINSGETPLDNVDELVDYSLKIIRRNRTPFYRKYLLAILIIILILSLGIFALQYYDIGNNGDGSAMLNPEDVNIKIIDFHLDDVRDNSSSWNYSYFVSGEINSQPLNSHYIIITDFYDSDGNRVNSTEIEFTNLQKLGNNYIFGSMTSDTDNISRVEVMLADENDIILAQSESQLTGELNS